MFGFSRKNSGADAIAALHTRLVASSRAPALYDGAGMPDTVEGRFEALTLHVLVTLRRLRQLPPPANDVAQELVDAVFAHLEIALRELGVGDFGVPKRMKKLGQAFYDRTAGYDQLLSGGEAAPLAAEIAARAGGDPGLLAGFARYLLASERRLANADLAAILAGPPFAEPDSAASAPAGMPGR